LLCDFTEYEPTEVDEGENEIIKEKDHTIQQLCMLVDRLVLESEAKGTNLKQ
jgi:hypothetical protein